MNMNFFMPTKVVYGKGAILKIENFSEHLEKISL